MERVPLKNAKKQRVEFPMREPKQEAQEEEGQTSGGGAVSAMVLVQAPAPVVLDVKMNKAQLDCPRCTLPLKPPIFQFQCEAGHFVCGTCYAILPMNKNKCYSCHKDGAYLRNTPLEDFVGAAKVLCRYKIYGCGAYVAYHSAGDHQGECPYAPCRCSEPGCAFEGSPPMLRDHLRDTHAWTVEKISYGRAHNVRLSEVSPRRVLDAVQDDGRVFVVAMGAHGSSRLGVTVACLRSSGAAAAGSSYSCTLWANGNTDAEVKVAMAEADVPSYSSVPGPGNAATAAAETAPLSVLRSMLQGEAMEMHLSIKIDKSKK